MNFKLTPQQAEMMKVFREFNFTPIQIAKAYGVHADTVRNVLSGKSHHGTPPPRSDRKLTGDQARQVLAWSAEGLGEMRIQNRLKAQGTEIGCSTIRQVINRQSYQDVS